ncbi:MAG: 50S ribosomal protein L1 [Aggregatilineales bacterium]
MMPAGKRYNDIMKKVDRDNYYPIDEAITLVKEIANTKFDETVEMHFHLGIDPRHSDQQVRSTVMLPNGTGKSVRVLVFAEGEDARLAEEAGADVVADDEILNKIQNEGWLDFDATLSTPDMMRKVGRVARVLGPRGLMPNPKAGTVVQGEDLARAIDELKAGRVEFRNDKTGNLHIPIGKASFENAKLLENAQAVVAAVEGQKPSGIKGIYIRRMTIASTMSPGIRVQSSNATE